MPKRLRTKVNQTVVSPKQTPLLSGTPLPERHEVYSLRFPDTRKVFYIGIGKDAYKRFVQHIQMDGSNKDKDATIADLKKRGLAPVLHIENGCPDRASAEIAESAFIEYYRAWGHPLCNKILPLNGDMEAARQTAEYEQKVQKRYASKWYKAFVSIRPFFIFNKHQRQEYIWQRDDDYSVYRSLKTRDM